MAKFLPFLFILFWNELCAQEEITLDSLQASKAIIQAKLNAANKEVSAAKKELAAIENQMNIRSGWMRELSGSIGFSLAGSQQWISNPNPTSTSTGLSIHLTGFANRKQPKYFWNNKIIITKAWQKVELTDENDSKFFDNGTVDILNLSSLAGYRFNEKWAVSGLTEFNSSIENFLEPGTLDFGVGITWNPATNASIALHPLNYHTAWSSQEIVESQSALGAKLRVDVKNKFKITARTITWSSTLTGFLPYTNTKTTVEEIDNFGVKTGAMREAGLYEWTWMNRISFQLWKNIGVGFNLGFRKADFEFPKLQRYYDFGLTFTL